MNRCKYPKQIINKLNPVIQYIMTKWILSQECKVSLTVKSISLIHHITELRHKVYDLSQ